MNMPWNKSKETNDENKETPEEKEAKAQEAFMEKIGALVEGKLKPLSDNVTTLQEKWTKLEAAASAGDEGGEEHKENDGGGAPDPEKQRQLHDRKVLTAIVATNARLTESEVIKEVREKFPEFEEKVRKILQETGIDRKALPDYPVYCRNVVKMIIGEAAIDGGLHFDTESKRFFLEDNTSKDGKESFEFLAADTTWQDPRSGKILTGREQLAKLGITPEQFNESVKKGLV